MDNESRFIVRKDIKYPTPKLSNEVSQTTQATQAAEAAEAAAKAAEAAAAAAKAAQAAQAAAMATEPKQIEQPRHGPKPKPPKKSISVWVWCAAGAALIWAFTAGPFAMGPPGIGKYVPSETTGPSYTPAQLDEMISAEKYPEQGPLSKMYTQTMSFEDCRLSIFNYLISVNNIFPVRNVVDTNIVYGIHMWTVNGALVIACSQLDSQRIITVAPYK